VTKESDVQQGVRDAWDSWLNEHSVSVPDLIEAAVKDATTRWLNRNGDDLFKDAVSQWLDKNGAKIFKLPDGGHSEV
jgi:hypothetical protein